MAVPGCHLESPQASLAAEDCNTCKLMSEVPGKMGEYLERHTLCIAIPCKYSKSQLCEVLTPTSSAWFHVKKALPNPLQLPPLSVVGTTV